MSTVANSAWLFLLVGGAAGDQTFAEFVKLAGGPDAPIVIVPHASEDPKGSAKSIRKALKKAGARDIRVIMPDDDFELRPTDKAVWVGGGDQTRLVGMLGRKGIAELEKFLDRGGLYAGSSAGAAAVSHRMIAGGMKDLKLEADSLRIAGGLELIKGIVVDTHVGERHRQPRALMAIAEVYRLYGELPLVLCLNEDTAVFLKVSREGDTLGLAEGRVVGRSHAWIFEPDETFVTNLKDLEEGDLVSVSGVRVSARARGLKLSLDLRPSVRKTRKN